MNDSSELTTTTGQGAQGSTQNPQVVSADSQTASAQSVQPGTATSLLNNSQGIPLSNAPVTTVSLSSSTSTPVTVTPTHHGINPVLGALSVLLFVGAIALFYLTSRSAKKTTL